jgi:hypothetical protein
MPKVSRTRKHSRKSARKTRTRKHSRKSARKTRVRRQRGGLNCRWYIQKTKSCSPCLDGRRPNRCKADNSGLVNVFDGNSLMAAFDDNEEDVYFYDIDENPCAHFYYYELVNC